MRQRNRSHRSTVRQNSKFAPAGFGLGESSGRYCDNPDLVTTPGFYSMGGENVVNSAFVGTTFSIFKYGTLLVENRYGFICQTFKYNGYVACRLSTNEGSTWSELEWNNPPMALGTEYRTTEKWQGKPVYTMLLDFGALPNATSKTIYITVPVGGAKIEVFSVCGKFSGSDGSNGELLAFDKVRSHWATCTTNAITLGIITSEDATGYNAWITIKYTKD